MGAFLIVCKHSPSLGAKHEATGHLTSTTRKQTMPVLLSSPYSVQDPDYPMRPFCPCWEWGFWPQLNISGNAITDCPRGFSPRWFKYYPDDKVQILVCFLASLSISETSTWSLFVCILSPCVSSSLENPDSWRVYLLLSVCFSEFQHFHLMFLLSFLTCLASVLSSLPYMGHGDSCG